MEQRLEAAGAHGEDAGLPARQGAAQDGRAAVRLAGALGGASATTVRAGFGDAVRSQNLRVAGYPRIEPQGRRGRRRPARVQRRCSRSIPEITLGDLSRRDDRAAASPTVGRRRGRQAPSRCCASSARRYDAVDARGAGRRPRDRRLHRHASTASAFHGGQATDFPIVLGEGAHAAGVRGRSCAGMTAGETQDLPT
ncbi:MAG: hypothetical protein MZV65_18855 [Chromatiales bacterium]|nr:hypothetical protein [Chromatiales bacterium]